jgi:hypothetical protein
MEIGSANILMNNQRSNGDRICKYPNEQPKIQWRWIVRNILQRIIKLHLHNSHKRLPPLNTISGSKRSNPKEHKTFLTFLVGMFADSNGTRSTSTARVDARQWPPQEDN